MAQFLFLFRGGDPREAGMSPEQMQRHMERWNRWSEELKRRGLWLGGQPLEKTGRVVGAEGVVSDGPFAESKEMVGGYVLIDVANLEEAAALAEGCPIYEAEGVVEVRPITSDGLCANDSAHRDHLAGASAT